MTPAAALAAPIASSSEPTRDVLVVAAGERARGQDLVGEADAGTGRRRRGASVEHVGQRRRRELGRGSPEGSVPTTATPSRRGRSRRGRRSPRRPPAATPAASAAKNRSANRTASAAPPTASVAPLTVAERAHDLGQLRQRLARVDREPEQLAQLADHEHDRDAVDVAHEHRPREVVGDPPEPQQPREDEAAPRRAAPASRRARRRPRSGGRQREHGRGRRAPTATPRARRSAGARSPAARRRPAAAAARRAR